MYRGFSTKKDTAEAFTLLRCLFILCAQVPLRDNLFQTAHLLDCLDGVGQGAAHSHACHQAGIVVGEEGAGHIAGDIQAGHRLVVVVQSLTLVVDGNALLGTQQGGTQPAAVEGSGADGAQTISGLAEILVVLLVVQLVVTLNGSKEGVLGLAGEAQLVGQLLDGVGLEEDALLLCIVHLLLDILCAGIAGLGRAADGVEALCVLQNVCVADLCVDTARLMSSSVDDVVVGAALVGEALTVAVDLQEGLSSGVVLADGAGEGLAAESGVACHITAVHAGSHDAAVEQHGRASLSKFAPAQTAARMP